MIMPAIAFVIIPIVIIVIVDIVSGSRDPAPAIVAEVPVLAAVLGLQITVEPSVFNPVVIIVDAVVLVKVPVLGLKGAVELIVVITVARITPIVVVFL